MAPREIGRPDSLPERRGHAAGHDPGHPARDPRASTSSRSWSSTMARPTARRSWLASIGVPIMSLASRATADLATLSAPASTRRCAPGADIIVNTDGDNQYYGGDIPHAGGADPGRQARRRRHRQSSDGEDRHTSLQPNGCSRTLAAWVVSRLANLEVSRMSPAASAPTVATPRCVLGSYTEFDHTVEHAIQAGQSRLAVEIVRRFAPTPRPGSRASSTTSASSSLRSGLISLRTYAMYKALKIFTAFGMVSFTVRRRPRAFASSTSTSSPTRVHLHMSNRWSWRRSCCLPDSRWCSPVWWPT